jgi:hypothetical protein
MARTAQTHAKRARELALKEKRERKQAKKAERAAAAASPPENDFDAQGDEDQAEIEVGTEEAE